MRDISHLEIFKQYNRKDVHDIFDPFSKYSSGSGTWGIHGIVKIPNREGDYVFFVTFGQEKLGHVFDEELTEEGILTWQSQPSQKLTDLTIKGLIKHDPLRSNIYLFLRTRNLNSINKKSEPFTYMGKLAYLCHDNEREAPVFFKWRLLGWNIPSADILSRMNLQLAKVSYKYTSETSGLHEENRMIYRTEAPERESKEKGISTNQFRAKHFNFIQDDERNKDIGLKGELLVLKHIKAQLREKGLDDYADDTVHTSVIEGDGAGYDIQSFTCNGEPQFIEVKTTAGEIRTPFYLTSNEIAFSEKHQDSYILYRVYEYDFESNSGKFYVLEGDIKSKIRLQPIQFKAFP